MQQDQIREKILSLVSQYAEMKYVTPDFRPGVTMIPPAGKVLGEKELRYMVEASLDGWLTTGRFNEAFEKKLGEYLGVSNVLTVASGSAANLLAITALMSPKLGSRSLNPGDEVITVAAGFPTTINPIIQNGLIPVFVDIEIATYNLDVSQLESAISDKTKAIILAHTLGNTYNVVEVKRIAKKFNLWLIEDCCDALGSTYNEKMVGTFGDIATVSFYPAHHITMGEGGAVFTNAPVMAKIIESLRDWGRDCYCQPGKDNTCGKRFDQQLGTLPKGYDHKYTYSHLGYNLKITDMQAACALAQMDRLDDFVAKRKRNFNFLKNRLKSCNHYLRLPQATQNSNPSWFGFPITINEGTGINRVDLLKYLEQHKIGTRLLFAGNITRQPYMADRIYRISGELKNTDIVMNNAFWLGIYPGLNNEMLEYVGDTIETFFGLNF